MYYKISSFEKDWRLESDLTLNILNTLTDKSLSQRVTEEGRTLGRLAWHLVVSVGEMMTRTGLSFYAVSDDSEHPQSAGRIAEEYKKTSESLVESLKKNWNDESLKEEVQMYGETWTKGHVLTVLIRHQIHHRAQMTVLMRQAGLKVPGTYGPSREEWAAMNMPPME